jgi:hypothetical protein
VSAEQKDENILAREQQKVEQEHDHEQQLKEGSGAARTKQNTSTTCPRW